MKQKRFFTVIILIIFSIIVHAEVIVKESNDFLEVERFLKLKSERYGVDEVLLVSDLDDTLLTSKTDLGSDIWYRWQNQGIGGLKPEKQVDNLFEVIGILYELGSMKPVEVGVSKMLMNWQTKGLTMFVLTSRGPNYRAATERELERYKFDFAKNALKPVGQFRSPVYAFKGLNKKFGKSKYIISGKADYRGVTYINGIMMTTGLNKGVMLDSLLEKTGREFEAIIFVDDSKKNVENVKRTFQNREDVDVTIVHYTKVESDRKKKYGKVITKTQASKMEEDWNKLLTVFKEVFPERWEKK